MTNSTSGRPATEGRSPRFVSLETWPPRDIMQALLSGQHAALGAVAQAIPALEGAVRQAVQRLEGEKGRIIYVGAGTSGRLAVLDGTEMTPTFGWPASRLAYLFAGGDTNPERADEGAEDDAVAGRERMAALQPTRNDVVLGVAASGSTPFTCAAIDAAGKGGALTVGFANNSNAPLLAAADHAVCLPTGPEVLAGSTRLAAGTSQKAALNLFSTTLMIGLNRVHAGHMVDMQVSNEKLQARARNMVMDITGCAPQAAQTALAAANNNAKLAVLLVQGLDVTRARERLRRCNGNLAAALEQETSEKGNGGTDGQ